MANRVQDIVHVLLDLLEDAGPGAKLYTQLRTSAMERIYCVFTAEGEYVGEVTVADCEATGDPMGILSLRLLLGEHGKCQ